MPNQMKAARASAGAPANLYQGLLPPRIVKRVKDFFTWVVDWEGATPLAVSSSSARTWQADADSDALVVALTGVVWAAGAFTLPAAGVPIKLTIKDSGSGRDEMSAAVAWDTLVGTAQLPGFLPYPKLIPANSTVRVTAENLDPANAWDVHLSFLGFKIFRELEED